MTDYDFEIMAKTIYGEARGESRQGQTAVACVIFNRFRSGKWFASRAAQPIIAPMPRYRTPSGQTAKSRVLSVATMYFLRGLTDDLYNDFFNRCGLKRFVAYPRRIVQRTYTGK